MQSLVGRPFARPAGARRGSSDRPAAPGEDSGHCSGEGMGGHCYANQKAHGGDRDVRRTGARTSCGRWGAVGTLLGDRRTVGAFSRAPRVILDGAVFSVGFSWAQHPVSQYVHRRFGVKQLGIPRDSVGAFTDVISFAFFPLRFRLFRSVLH